MTLLLDALDEAYPADQTAIASDLLRALAERPGVRVIVGTRPNREDPDSRPASHIPWTAEGPLIRALTPEADRMIRLDTDPGSRTAITSYVRRRLLDSSSPYLTHPQKADAMAEAIAAHSDGIFLFARLLTRSLTTRQNVLDPASPEAATLFSGGVAEAFEEDLKNYGRDRERVHGLLAPLAWAEGAGLPRRDVWLTIANALARPGLTFTETDIAWVLEHAGAHIVESGEDGQTVYRLYHQAFNDYFHTILDHQDIQRRITQALIALAERP